MFDLGKFAVGFGKIAAVVGFDSGFGVCWSQAGLVIVGVKLAEVWLAFGIRDLVMKTKFGVEGFGAEIIFAFKAVIK